MIVLVTGSTGNLGMALVSALCSEGISLTKYSHSQNLSDIEWKEITHIVNCAAVIPKAGIVAQDYIDGNVEFLQRLLPYCKGKIFISFSSFSELFRFDIYQHSKLLANSILMANSDLFEKWYNISLPTLSDGELIEFIRLKAISGGKPIVDNLNYNYISFDNVAKFTVEKIVSWDMSCSISDRYEKKNLYQEVCKNVNSDLIVQGKKIDRQLLTDGIYHCCPIYLSTLI